jgi:hypothetical protein
MKTTVVLAAGVLFTQLLAAAQEPATPKAPNNPAVATANTSVNTHSQPDQKQSKKAKDDKKAKKVELPMQPDDPRKSPWAEPRDWNWINSAY